MKFNFKFFLFECFNNIIKFGKIKSNFIKLKKIFRKLNKLLNIYFKKKIYLYIIKKFYKKGDKSLVGEIGFVIKLYNFFLIK